MRRLFNGKNTMQLKTCEEYGNDNRFCNDVFHSMCFYDRVQCECDKTSITVMHMHRLTVKLPVYRSLGL